MRFTGKDSEINVASPGGGHKAEFIGWRWEPMKNLPDLIVPFKRPVYERVVQEFASARRRVEYRRMANGKPYRPNVGSRCSTRPGGADRPPHQGTTALKSCCRAWNGRCRRAASTRARIRAMPRCANCGKRPAAEAEYLGETDWLSYEFPSIDGARRTGWRRFAASARNGSRCDSPATTTRSIR